MDTDEEGDEELIPGDVGTVIQVDIQALHKKFDIGSDETALQRILGGWRAVATPRLRNMVITDMPYLAQPAYT